MQTPIADFLEKYEDSGMIRFHMPGHKGKADPYDITEVNGADSLYEADGIIRESEENAAALFGSKRTLYSAEGSSLSIRAMLFLALKNGKGRKIIAGRNAHKAFLYAAALLDLDVCWLMPKESNSLLSCHIEAAELEELLAKEKPIAVYLTSPDYLGGMADIRSLSAVCHKHSVPLLVDNAHGAYLRFLESDLHPLSLGADMCCDSAHKTLPVLTGGAYLHIGKDAPDLFYENAKQAMALFGSTSPSYLILRSLDLANKVLAEENAFPAMAKTVAEIKNKLKANGWQIMESEPLKITVKAPKDLTGFALAENLRKNGIECEYADADFLVLMPSPMNTKIELEKLVSVLGKNELPDAAVQTAFMPLPKRAMSIRAAIFAPHIRIKTEEALGKICAAPTVSCPPAIPIAVSGEIIDENILALFRRYGIGEVEVLR